VKETVKTRDISKAAMCKVYVSYLRLTTVDRPLSKRYWLLTVHLTYNGVG